MKVLVTAANGRFGQATVPRLLARGVAVRGLVASDASADALRRIGAEALVGDVNDAAVVRRALDGVDKAFLVVPPGQRDECVTVEGVVAEARRTGLAHLVYLSVLQPQMQSIALHWNKGRAQTAIIDAGLNYTFLQSTNLMQNLQWSWPLIAAEGRFVMPYSAEVATTWVDAEDAGEAACEVLTGSGHELATHELVGTAPLTRHRLAAAISAALGRTVVAEKMPVEDFFKTGSWPKRSPESRAISAAMFDHIDRHGLAFGGRRHLRWLLGREPTGYDAFARRFVAAL